MLPEIVAVMVTVDRSPAENYLAATLDNLARSGLRSSPHVARLVVFDSGPGFSFARRTRDAGGYHEVCVVGPGPNARITANENVAKALRVGASWGPPWVVFIEDDIDVCADFFGSTAAWLADHERPDVYAYPLAAAYDQVERKYNDGCTAWRYPLASFYGTQAVAFRREDARAVADYIDGHRYELAQDGTAYDLLMSRWALARGATHFLTPAPSFVEHIGRGSVIRPRPETHRFASWPGRDWSYAGSTARRKAG
jgi:hypothetical protein